MSPGGERLVRDLAQQVADDVQPAAPLVVGMRDVRGSPVVNDEYRATSLLATMRERWNLGAPFTARDASARSLASIFTLNSPRAQEDWPEISARPVPAMPETLVPLDAPLGVLGKSLLFAILAFAQGLGKTVPDIKPDDTITGAQAIAIGHEALGELLPSMRDQADH
jgi:phospholipase C